MRRVLFALSLLAVVPACAPKASGVAIPDSGTLRFGSEKLQPGLVVVQTERGELDGKMRYGLRGAELEVVTQETTRLEVLGLEGDRPSELRVTYEDARTSTWDSMTHESSEEVSPVMRQTYRLSHRPGSLEVRDDVSLAEYAELREDFVNLGPQFSVPKALANRTVEVGDTLTITEDIGDEYTFNMTLLGASVHEQQAVAVFAFDMKGEASGGTYDIDGRVLVALDSGRLVSMRGTGPFRAKVSGAKVKGEMTVEWTYRYSQR